MEIVDYLRIARKRLFVLILIPVLAGTLSVVYVFLTPREYTASAYVSAPTLVGGESSPYGGYQGTEQFVNDLTAAAASPGVALAVAKQTRERVPEILDQVSATQVARSGDVKITYVAADPDRANAVVTAVAAQSLNSMFAPPVEIAEENLAAAKDSLRESTEAVAAAEAGDETTSTGDRAEYEVLLAQQRAAERTLTAAYERLADTRTQLAAAQPERAVHPSPATMSPLTPLLVTSVLSAVGGGLFIAIGVVAFMEVAPGLFRLPRLGSRLAELRIPRLPRRHIRLPKAHYAGIRTRSARKPEQGTGQ